MEKTVMVLNVENAKIKVNNVATGEKEISKSTVLMTDGYDRFVAEAFDKVAEGVEKSHLEGKLCNVVCQLTTNKAKETGRVFNSIRINSIKGLFDTMDEFLDEEKKENG